MNKRILMVSACVIALSIFPLTAEAQSSETTLYSEVVSAYHSKSYPAAVEYASQLEVSYPRSLLLGQTLSYKGESLFRLGRLSEADTTLDKALSLTTNDVALQSASYYWKGRTQFAKESFEDALVSFYKVTTLSADGAYNAYSFLYAGKCYSSLQQYEKAIPVYEYVISHGKKYVPSEYENAFLNLFTAYLKTKKYERLVSVYEQLPENAALFLSDVYGECTIDAGDAYLALAKCKKAYECYSTVVTGDRQDLAAIALQKAYIVSSEHQKEVGQDSGTVLAQAKNSLSEYPELIAEFYIRLGIDSYTVGAYEKATSYFDNAEQHASLDQKALIGLYRANMLLATGTKPADILSLLDTYAKKTSLTNDKSLYSEYEMIAVRCYVMMQNWNEVIVRAPAALSASQTQKEDTLFVHNKKQGQEETTYYYALASYKKNDFAKTVELLSTCAFPSSKESFAYKSTVLYARALAKTENTQQSLELFEKLDRANLLADADRVDYAKELLSQGFVNAAYKQASAVNVAEAWYVTGLASFNRKDWQNAEQEFKKYLSNSEIRYASYAQFYCGYAQYRLGKTADAYKTLTQFTSAFPTHELAWNARMTSANAAVQNNSFDAAVKEVSEAVRISSSEEQRQQSTLLLANVYADSGNSTKAVEVLAPYTKQPSEFGVRCRYQTAQLYARQNKLQESDNLYGTIAEQFKSNELADDSAYRRGELYYGAGSFAIAVARFETYRMQFPAGTFIDASYFYEGDSLMQLGQTDRAMLMYLTLVKTNPKSPYCFTAKKNLITMYRKQGDYNEALSLAQSLIAEYGDQAKDVAQDVAELKKLAGGEDEQIVKQRTVYENAGGLATREGRSEGTKLAALLWKKSESQVEAVTLASKLYALQSAKQNEDKESAYAAQTALIIAQNMRQSESNKESAEKYLAVAKYARMNKDDELAARALYGAVEAFDAAGMSPDANETETTLAKLYPSSSYTQQAKAIVEK